MGEERRKAVLSIHVAQRRSIKAEKFYPQFTDLSTKAAQRENLIVDKIEKI